MYTPFKMKGKSPLMKKLIGNQHRLPEHLKAKIEAAPESPAKMMKKSPAKMAKKSPTKNVNPFSAEYKRMTVSQRKKKYGDNYKIQGSDKTGTLRDAVKGLNKKIQDKASKVDKFIKGPKGGSKLSVKHEGPGKTTIKRVAKGTTPPSQGNTGGFTSRKGDPYLYRKNADGTFTTKKGKDGKEIIVKKGSKGYDAISSVFKLKKSPAKMAKKSPAKKYKSDAQRKAVHASKADGGKGAPAKMMKKSAAKLKKKSAAKMMKKSPNKLNYKKK